MTHEVIEKDGLIEIKFTCDCGQHESNIICNKGGYDLDAFERGVRAHFEQVCK